MSSWTRRSPRCSDGVRGRLRRRPSDGVTLPELLLVVAIVAVLMAGLAPGLRALHRGWQVNDRRSEVLQNARVGMEEMTRILRQMRQVTSVSGPADTSGYLEFRDRGDTFMRFERDSQSGYLKCGPPDSLSLLAGPASALTFTCYDTAGDQLPEPVDGSQVRSMAVDLTVTDAEAQANPVTLSSKVFMRKDVSTVTINEIMYNPSGPDAGHEWIELYNVGPSADLADWALVSTTNWDDPDTLYGDDRFGSGSTVLPTGGYAVIVGKDTEVYEEVLVNRGFEAAQMSAWNPSSNWNRVTDGDAHEGNWKLARDGAGSIYQERTLPATAVSAFFSCWEKTPSPDPGSTRLIITIRNTADQVLATLYDGPMHSAWTRHFADLTPYIGGTRRIYFETGSVGTYWIDDVSMSWSYADKDAVRLRVDDGDLGGALKDNSDAIVLISGAQVVDGVTYDDSWGGDGNDKTLERISPTGDPTDAANWAEGPENGTPGRINQASQP